MSNPHLPVVSVPRLLPKAERAASWLQGVIDTRGHVRIASLGPTGTSAHDVLNELASHLTAGDTSRLQFELCSSFEAAVHRVLDGAAEYALVPSAYNDVTAFHWDTLLELACIFVHRTPDYGLAVRPETLDSLTDGVVVAAMPEVRGIYSQLVPDHLAQQRHEFAMATSTSNAASIVREGSAHIAVCNELGRQEHDLVWVSRRDGAEIVWMLFERHR